MMHQQHQKQQQVQVFCSRQIGSTDGSVLSNKEFYMAYHVLNTDLYVSKQKRIIGLLYNTFDREYLYYQCYVPISQNFNLEWLLSNVIYSRTKRYSNHIMKQLLLEDRNRKYILSACEKAIKARIGL